MVILYYSAKYILSLNCVINHIKYLLINILTAVAVSLSVEFSPRNCVGNCCWKSVGVSCVCRASSRLLWRRWTRDEDESSVGVTKCRSCWLPFRVRIRPSSKSNQYTRRDTQRERKQQQKNKTRKWTNLYQTKRNIEKTVEQQTNPTVAEREYKRNNKEIYSYIRLYIV